MKEKVKKLTQNTAIYGFGNALNKFMGIFLIPLYAKLIPIDQFGILAVFEMSILFFLNIIPLGITSGHERFIILEKEKKEYNIFLFNNYSALLLISFTILFIFTIFNNSLSFLITGDTKYGNIVILVCISLFFDINNIIPIQKLQYENKPVPYVLQNLFKLIVSISSAIFFVTKMHYGIEGLFLGRIAGASLLFFWQLFRNVIPACRFHFDISKVVMAIRYGFPMVFSSIGFLLFLMSDRYLVNICLGNDAAGKYSFGYRIASMLLIVTQSIGVSYLPSLFSHENRSDNRRYYVKMLTYYTFIISWIIIVFIFFYKIPLWPLVQNKTYWEGLGIVPILCFAFLVQGMTYFVNVGVSLTGNNRFMILPSFVIAAINIGLNIWLLPKFGFVFAACDVLLSHLLSVSIYSYYSNKFYNIHFEWGKIIFAGLTSAIVIFIGTLSLFNESLIARLIIRLLLLSLYPFILCWLGFFEKIEIATIKGIFQKAFFIITKSRSEK
jgi:O-antigen/teichoic acid export membrane protein